MQTTRFQNIAEYVAGHFGHITLTPRPSSWLPLVALQVFGDVLHVHPGPFPMTSVIFL